jgi:hypothetical protein
MSSGLLRRVVSKKFTDVLEVLAASIIRAVSKTRTRNLFEIGHCFMWGWNSPSSPEGRLLINAVRELIDEEVI